MKKILSFALVLAMMLPMIIMPVGATEPNAEWNWEGMFEEYDIRNVGQPKFNVGAAETTGVVVDGKIDANDNYTVEKTLVYSEISADAPAANAYGAPDITVRMARKGAYLYLSFQMIESTANHSKSKIQLGMNIYNGPTIANSVTRAESWLTETSATFKSVSTFGENGNYDNKNLYDGTARNSGYTDRYVVEYKKQWVQDAENTAIGLSTYEAKIDIARLSLITTTSTYKPYPDTEANMLGLMFYYYENGSNYARYFWYNVNSKWNNENNPYKDEMTAAKFVEELKKQEYGYVPTWGTETTEGTMLPIAFGGETIQLVHQQEPVGAVGTDVRNVEEGHLITIPSISEVAPVVDGVIGENEYTVKDKKFEFKTSSEQSYVTVNLAYKDGYIYIAAVTTESAASATQLDLNAMPTGSKLADVTVNRNGHGVKVGGDVPSPTGCLVKKGDNAWASTAQVQAMLGEDFVGVTDKIQAVVDAEIKSNGVDQTVYEYKVSAALLADWWGRIYNVPSGISIFGLQIWTHGVTNQNAMNDTGAAKRKTLDGGAWGLDWGLYTIQTPEATDAYIAEHNEIHLRELKMETGASARISSEAIKSGLRFKTTFTAAFIDQIKAAAGEEELIVGTIIAPRDYVTATGTFTMEALDAKYGEGKGYVKVVADLENAYDVADNGDVTIAGSITNIKNGNIQRDFDAIAFVQYGDTILYSAKHVVRNVYEIVDAAVKDTKTASATGYTNEVETGVFSPYTVEEYATLKAQLARYDEILAG